MDDPLLSVKPRFHFTVHKQPLSLRQTIAQVRRRAVPEQAQAPGIVYQGTDKQLRSAARIVFFLEPTNLADESLVSADRGIGNFFYLPPVFVTERQMIKQIFDGF